MKSTKTTLTVGVLLSLMSTGVFAAEQADKTYYFDEVVVTASGRPETLFTTKSNTQVITSEQIERMHYKTVKEAVRNVSGVQLNDYGRAGFENSNGFRINGTQHVVMLVDGVRVSLLGGESTVMKQLMNDMDAIERIEVVKGSASVLYGADAVGGVVNIITKKPDQTKTKVGIEGGSFNHEDYSLMTQGKVNKTSYRFFANKYHDGAYDDGKGKKIDTWGQGYNLDFMINHEFSKGNDITLTYRKSDEDFRYFNSQYYMGGGDEYDKGENKVDNFTLNLNNTLNKKVTNKFVYSFNKYKSGSDGGVEYGIPWNPWAYAYKTNNFKDIVTYENKDNTLNLGLEYIKSKTIDYDKYAYEMYSTMYGKVESGKYVENKSIFVQDNWKFGKGWDLTAGIRLDDAKTSRVDIDKNWSKSINLGYEFNKNTNAYIGYNDYFYLPTMGQLYNTSYGNDKLDAAKGKNYEIGFNHKFTPNDVVSAHYFYRKSDKGIDYTGVYGGPGQYINTYDTLKSHGFDIQYDKTFDGHWHAKLGWSMLTTDEEKMGYLPKQQYTLGVDYTADKWNVGLDVRAFAGRNGRGTSDYMGNWYDKYDLFPCSTYFLADLSVNYKATKDIKVYVKVNNLFDKFYAEQSNVFAGYACGPDSFTSMPGRAFIVGMNWSF